MNDRAWLRRAVLAADLLALAAFAASQGDPWTFLVAGSVVVAGFALSDGPRGLVMPGWAVRASVVAGILWGTLEFLSRPAPVEAARTVGLVVAAGMCVKAWDRRGPTDWRQSLILSVVLAVSSTLHSSDFLVGVLVMSFACAAVPSAMLLQVRSGAEAAVARLRAPGPRGRRGPVPEPVEGTAAARSLARTAALAVALAFVASVGVFAAFPREIAGSGRGTTRVSGFRPDVDLWSGGRISLSSRVAMTVRLLDPQGAPGKLVSPLRMRGAVLDRYEPADARWTGRDRFSRFRRFDVPAGGDFVPLAPVVRDARSNVWTQEVQMRSFASDRILSAWMPLAVACDEARTFGLDRSTGEIFDIGGAPGRPASYAVRMSAYPPPHFVEAVLPGPTGTAGSEPGFPVERVGEIARQVLAQRGPADLPGAEAAARDPAAARLRARLIADTFEAWLSGGGFAYTTDLSAFRRDAGDDPIVQFLDRTLAGHCEHFASALAALCLASGVEARVVTGFVSNEYDTVTDRYVFRESGAHAWVEVRVAEGQWMTFDPSPMAELEAIQLANRTWMDGFRWLLDPVEFTWNSRFAGFDARAQAALADRVGRAARSARSWGESLADRAAAFARANFVPGATGIAWAISVLGIAAAASAILVILSRRVRRVSRVLGASARGTAARVALLRDAGFYLDALDALERAGAAKPAWRTPMAHAEALRRERPGAGEAFAAVVSRLYDVRYGGVRPTRAGRASAAAEVAALRRALRDGYTR
jgi:hypothetical protein